jgi:Tol biopolymer transport system component
MRAHHRAAAIAGTLAFSMAGGVGVAQAAPDPARIAFSSAGRILTIDADGSDRRQLSGPAVPDAGDVADGQPVWSPDRKTIAFVRETKTGRYESRAQVYVMGADGGNPRPLTSPASNAYDFDPQWSPDGRSVAFTRYVEKRRHLIVSIMVIRGNGAVERQVVSNRLRRHYRLLGEPAWSPDGKRLAFTETTLDDDAHFRPSLHIVNADGTGRRLLTPDAASADWSPDGSRIAFASIRDRNGEACGSDECSYNGEIYVMRSDGIGLARLTNNEGNDYGPDWSQDGQRIAFSSDRNYPDAESPELYSIEPDSDCLTWLTNGSPESSSPNWEPDAAASTSPGGCGATPRPPLVEYGPGAALGVKRHPVMWLGTSHGTALLSWVSVDRSGTVFDYSDCSRFDPEDCDPGVYVDSAWVCHPTSINGLLGGSIYVNRFFTRRAALLAWDSFDGGLSVHAGQANMFVLLDVDTLEPGALGQHLAVFDDLRGFNEPDPSGNLPPATLPKQVVRRMRELVSLRNRLGSVAAVKRKRGIRPYLTRNALRLDDALDDYGRVDKVRCPKRYTDHAFTLRSSAGAAPASAALGPPRAADPSIASSPHLPPITRLGRG